MTTTTTTSHKLELKGFFAGIASGITKLIIGHPFDTLKVRLQTSTKFNGVIHCLRTTIRKEGIRGLYKGATPPLFGWAIMDSVMLGSLANFKILLQQNNDKLGYLQHGVAGVGAGWCVSVVATPIELIKAQLQVQYDKNSKYSGPVNCLTTIYRHNGISGLWRGFSGCLLFRSFFFVLWSSYEYYNRTLGQLQFIPDAIVPFLSGGLAANTFWIVAFPADVVKNRMMSQSDERPLKYPNIRVCVREVYKSAGMRGFYRGFVPCILRSFPTNGAALFMFEMVYRW